MNTRFDSDGVVVARAVAKIQALADEVAETNKLLLAEIDRDRKLMAGIQKRDKEIAELKSKIAALEAANGPLPREGNRLLPNKWRGTEVSPGMLKFKKKYWSLRQKVRKGFRK